MISSGFIMTYLISPYVSRKLTFSHRLKFTFPTIRTKTVSYAYSINHIITRFP